MRRSRALATMVLAGIVIPLVLADAPTVAAVLPPITSVAALERATPGARPIGIALDPIARRLYVANSESTELSITDAATNQVIATVPIGGTPNQVVVNPLTGRAYVSNFAARTVSVVDGRSASVVRTLPVGGLGLAIDPAGQRVFAAAGDGLAVIDAATDLVLSEVSAPEGANLWGVAAGPGDLAYVTDLFAPRIFVFDAAQGAFVGEIAIDAPARFAMIASADGGRLYVAGYVPSGARLSVIDTARRRVISSVPVGGLPFGVALDAVRGLAYVTSFSEDTISTIDTARATVRATLAAGRSPAGIAFDPTAGRLFVANASEAREVTQP